MHCAVDVESTAPVGEVGPVVCNRGKVLSGQASPSTEVATLTHPVDGISAGTGGEADVVVIGLAHCIVEIIIVVLPVAMRERAVVSIARGWWWGRGRW